MNIDAKILNKILANRTNNILKRAYIMTKLSLFQGCKDSSIFTNQTMWYTISTDWKIKNHMIISIDAEKSFDKMQYLFMILKKHSPAKRQRRNISQHNKNPISQTHSKHYHQWWKIESISPKVRKRQGCPLSPLLFNIVLEVLATAIRAEKEIKKFKLEKKK